MEATMAAPAVLITGGTSGIGLASAQVLHEQGFRVMVTGQNPETIAAAELALPKDVVVFRADSRSLTDAGRIAEAAQQHFGSLAAVFLNAGVTGPTPLGTVDEARWDELFAINTKGQYFTLQAVMPLMSDGGSIVLTAGVGIVTGITGGSVVAGTRGALLSMVPSLALELAPRRIRVNAVSPGAIDTPIWAKSGLSPEAIKQRTNAIAATIPFGRLGTAREVADVVAFFVSERSSYVTGQHIVVAGGIGMGA
jgi:NAD(P)-dependent dehydrogenase (short-subunit alcohol dehydrogenase family)